MGLAIGAGYVLEELIGRGGAGRVYRARQEALDRLVAVKVLHPHLLSNDESVARFYTEARAASRLSHPCVVSVYDFGLAPHDAAGPLAGAPYLVMEHLAGSTLRARLRGKGPLGPRAAVRAALDVLSALSEAHAAGVVHRDLKPENVFLVPTRDGCTRVKVVDFGLARLLDSSWNQRTEPGVIRGTPAYTAPERWLGQTADARADLYSLGVMLFESIAGRTPYVGESAQLLLQHLTEAPPSLARLCPDRGVTPVLDEVLIQALAKSPDERFQNARAMAEALSDALEGLSHDADEPLSQRCAGCGSPPRSSRRERTPSAPDRHALPPQPPAPAAAQPPSAPPRRPSTQTFYQPEAPTGVASVPPLRRPTSQPEGRSTTRPSDRPTNPSPQPIAAVPVRPPAAPPPARRPASSPPRPAAVEGEPLAHEEDPTVMLILLEQAGTKAEAAGDLAVASTRLGQALELARRSLAATGDDMYERAVASLAIKLARVLLAQGNTRLARAVLDEVSQVVDGPPRAGLVQARARLARGD